MKKRLWLISSVIALSLAGPALAVDALRDQANSLFKPIPQTPPALPDEASTPEKVALGKMLYFDVRVSENHDVSCNSCHDIGLGGVDALSSSSGHNGRLGGRNVLTVLNAVFNTTQFWDGRAAGLKEQVLGSVMANPAALLKTRGGPTSIDSAASNLTKQHVVETLKGIPGYVEAFKKAFPSDADPIVYDNIGRAIAVFEATLITPDAPFDLWLKGRDSALNDGQKQGLTIFIEKGCASCHNGINIGGGMFARFGATRAPGSDLLPSDDWGRFAVTKNLHDKYVFKVPSLRNVELTAPYFHAGQTWDLRKAVAAMGDVQTNQTLSDDEIGKIVDFLKTLTGRQPEIMLPILPPRTVAPRSSNP
ncbi:MAG: cytochrome c peroxidase [Methylocystis sp.]